ncbi:MAP3K12-binding inhibitory protein 1 isoform X1 [Nothobranchius furzeri]|uniref:MAP3K12 binding inhibitory protein 1 n=1 Tax=Nothobranchius furzeri TaxID=105023 RepID=A0A1A8A810_NOTFU|nr:MAP3K12 binding inhibitory protein 1 [Nothobranchius furzeri]
MAETTKLSESKAPPSEPAKMSSYKHCMDAILGLLSDFGKELKLGDAALRIEVNPGAVVLSSSSEAGVYGCVQQHIAKLQAVSESLRSLVEADVTSVKEDTADNIVTSLSSEHRRHSSEAADCGSSGDDVMVQIRAGKSEIERRISAFMECKQMEINENNVREFCNVIDCNQENSCARTDAVFTPYPGFKSHIKVSRVVNTYGPQTRGGGRQGEAAEHHRGAAARDCGNAAIEERLQNMETHLKLPSVGPVPLTVYQRLKTLEDRILELEGLSPEYFQSTTHLHKRLKMSPAQACSLTELDEKISTVKAALLKRMSEFGPRFGPDCSL